MELEGTGGRIDIGDRPGDYLRIDIEHAPGTAGVADRGAVMHFARIDGNDVACPGLDGAPTAQGSLRPALDNSDTEGLVRVAGKHLGGIGCDNLDAGKGT
ncbi:hypothetical protein GCM10010862_30460 [Devosia nitrariae]|uniref:Uncharacterized protein n=1 Tax=Devosia nitrariae TaxID=2071872 RepID=A0ABQ5W6U4_9HYPH|nr:hypothetical protein GCM10010862_30460 [Devosia nitrariae]